jgi:hypothetical protein
MALISQGGAPAGSVATATRGVYHRIYQESKQPKSNLNAEARRLGYPDAAALFEKGADSDVVTFAKMVTNNGKNATMQRASHLGFIRRDTTAFLKLANSSAEEIARYRAEMANPVPKFRADIALAKENPTYKLQKMRAAYENAKLGFWDVIKPGLMAFIVSLTKLVTAIGNLPAATKKLMAVTALFVSLAAAAILVGGMFKSAILTLAMKGGKVPGINLAQNGMALTSTDATRAARAAIQEQILQARLAKQVALTNARAAKDSIQQQILTARLARQTALTDAVLARNVATAAKNIATKNYKAMSTAELIAAGDALEAARTNKATTIANAAAAANAAKAAKVASAANLANAAASARATRDAIQEQILKAKLAQELARTEGILARNAAMAAKNMAKAAKTMASTTAATSVSSLVDAAKEAVRKNKQGFRVGTAFQNQYPVVLRDPFTSNLHPTKKTGGWMSPTTVYRNGKWIDPSGGFKEKARAASQFLPVRAPNFHPSHRAGTSPFLPVLRTGNFTHGPIPYPLARRGKYEISPRTGNFQGPFNSKSTPWYGMGTPNYIRPGYPKGYTSPYGMVRRPTGAMVHSPYIDMKEVGKNKFAAGAAGMASGPGLFTRLGTSFASLSKSIGSTLVIVLKFLGIGALLYGFFKGLYQALQATLLPALSSVGIKFIGMGDIFAWVKDKLDILANFVGFVFVSIISTVQSVFAVLINVVQLIAESFTWLWHELKGLFTWGKTPKYTSTGFADIWADFKNTMTGGIFKENDKAYWDLLINPKTPPSGERAWKPTTPSGAGANDLGTSAISNTAFGAAGASKYFEAGTSAGYEALITANSAMITVLEKLRGDVNSRLDTTNDLLESNNGLLSGDTTRVEE